MKNEDIIKMNQGKKFDVILSNPPYNLANKMLAKYFEIGSEICTVQPSTWLLGKQQKKDIVKHVDTWDYSDIESINGNEFFDALIAGVMAIQTFKENDPINHNRHYILFDGKKYNKCEEITTISNDPLLTEFKKIVEPLYLKDNLQNHIKHIPNVHFYNAPVENNPNDNWWIFRMTRYSVHPDGKHTNWCIISRNMLKPYLYKDIKNKKDGKNIFLKYYIPSNNKQFIINLINYIQTDFCRTCLYLIQISYELGAGECKFIPYFDFNKEIFSKAPAEIDDYLFKKYHISDKIRKHIEELLPDYYNIRKGRD